MAHGNLEFSPSPPQRGKFFIPASAREGPRFGGGQPGGIRSPAVVLVVDISPFQRVEKRFDLRRDECDLLSHLNGKLALQLVLFPPALLNALGNHMNEF